MADKEKTRGGRNQVRLNTTDPDPPSSGCLLASTTGFAAVSLLIQAVILAQASLGNIPDPGMQRYSETDSDYS